MTIIPMTRRKPAKFEEAVRLYTAVQAAEILDVSDDYIYRRWEDHTLRQVDVGTNGRKKLRVRADDLQSFIDARTA